MDVGGVGAVALMPQRPDDSRLHQLGEPDDGVERRAQLVTHVGEEVALGAAGCFRLFLGGLQGPLDLLAIRLVDDRDENLRPAALVSRQDGQLDRQLEATAGQGEADRLAFKIRPAAGQGEDFLGEEIQRLVAEQPVQAIEQLVDIMRPGESDGGLVHLLDANECGATPQAIAIRGEVSPQILDAGAMKRVDELLHRGEILFPEGDRRVLEQAAVHLLAGACRGLGVQTFGESVIVPT